MKNYSRVRVVVVWFIALFLTGCMGWADMFRERRSIAGEYYLMEGEEGTADEIFLLRGHDTVSVAGPLKRIGWDEKYIIFTDANNPSPWNVVAVKEKSKFTITEIERTKDSRFQQIPIGSATQAWQKAKAERSR
jgi:hypothetical protein